MSKISIIKADITKQKVDAIVNSANKTLLGGGGVDGAIHRAAGPELLKKCQTLGGCNTGEVKITRGYNLPAKYIIHTVGPIYGKENGNEVQLLKNCYINSLKLASMYGFETIAFPAISTGIYGYPKKEAARIALKTVDQFITQNPIFDEIRLVLFSDESLRIYLESMSKRRFE